MITKTAQQLGIGILYHYQGYNPTWLDHMFACSSIRLSNPGAFNDPWDCKPHFNSDQLDDPVAFDTHVAYMLKSYTAHRPDLTADQITNRIGHILADRDALKSLLGKTSTTVSAAIDQKYRVYCLSTKPTHVLMWAHYGGCHAGICLGFRTNNPVFRQAMKVSYSATYPPLVLGDADSALRVMTVKSDVWSYEEEFRLFAQERAVAVAGAPLLTDSNFLEIPAGALESIVFGYLLPADKRQEIAALVDKHDPSIRLYHAVKVSNRYEFLIEDYPSAP